MLTDWLQQRLGSKTLRPLEGRRRTKLGAGFIFRGLSVALGQHQPVIQILIALGSPGRPGHLAIALLRVDVDAIIIGDKAFIQRGVSIVLGRHKHPHLDRLVGPGIKPHLSIHHPHLIGFILAERNVLHKYLIQNTAYSQQ